MKTYPCDRCQKASDCDVVCLALKLDMEHKPWQAKMRGARVREFGVPRSEDGRFLRVTSPSFTNPFRRAKGQVTYA